MTVSRPDFLRTTSVGAATSTLLGVSAPAAAPVPANAGRTGRLLIKNGYVVTLDRVAGEGARADVLVDRGKIVAIAPHISAADAAVIDATGTVVMPGFIDTHRHLWEGLLRNYFPDLSYTDYFKYMVYGIGPAYRPEDVYAGTLVSTLGAIDAGITTMLDFAHIQNSPAHTDASIHALRDSGMRAVFGYGYPSVGVANWWSDRRGNQFPQDITRIKHQYFSSDDQLMTLCLAAQGPGSVPDDITLMQWKVARDAGVRISVHAGSATKRGFYEPFANIPGFFGSDTTYIHCCAFTETEWKLVANSGGTISISPGSEMPMGHGMSAIQPALDHGIAPSLSVDVETTEPGDFFTTIRLTLYLQRQLINIRLLNGEKNVPKWLSARDILKLATIEGARACGLDHKTGTLTVGKDADIILLRADRINVIPLNDPVGAVAEGMDTSNVDTVIVKGAVLKRHGQLVGVDLHRIGALVTASRDAVIKKAGNVVSETLRRAEETSPV